MTSRAFTRNAVIATLAFPLLFVAVLCYMLRRAAYLDATRTGLVIIARYTPILDVFLALAVVVPASMLLGAVVGGAEAAGGAALLLAWLARGVTYWLLAGAVVVAVSSPGSFASTVGPETPRHNVHTVMGLSQLPGTRLTALLLARRVLAALPAGTVVAVAAATEDLARAYQRLGFTRGRKRRLYLVVGDQPRP